MSSFFAECVKLGVHLPPFGRYGVGVIFFPKEIRLREECREIFARAAEKLGLEILTYRKVPVNTTDIGPTALSVEPEMEHVFIACPDHIQDSEEFERKIICTQELCGAYHQQYGKRQHRFLHSLSVIQNSYI